MRQADISCNACNGCSVRIPCLGSLLAHAVSFPYNLIFEAPLTDQWVPDDSFRATLELSEVVSLGLATRHTKPGLALRLKPKLCFHLPMGQELLCAWA